jgi:nucleotide-binding universal stress UspA family protein
MAMPLGFHQRVKTIHLRGMCRNLNWRNAVFNRILLPLDGSKLAERAIPHAALFAHCFSSKIILLHILDPEQHVDTFQSIEPLTWQLMKAEADLYLQAVAARLRAQHLEVETVIREGKTAENIIDFSYTENIDLVIISTHGMSGLSRWNMSSVVYKIFEKIYLPVLLVRSYHDGEELALITEEAEGARPTPITYNRMMVFIDSSQRAECSLPAATILAQNLANISAAANSNGTAKSSAPKLYLATVIRQPDIPLLFPYQAQATQLVDQLMQITRESVSSYLEEIKTRLPVVVETRILEHPDVPMALHILANEENADLVVMCAHGQTGQTAWPYGSVARNYLEYGEKTVLIIQDIHRSQVRPTAAELAAEKYGKR